MCSIDRLLRYSIRQLSTVIFYITAANYFVDCCADRYDEIAFVENGRLIATVKGRHIDGGIIAGCWEKRGGRGKLTKEAKLQNADAHAMRTDACAPLTVWSIEMPRLFSCVCKKVFIVNKIAFYLLRFLKCSNTSGVEYKETFRTIFCQWKNIKLKEHLKHIFLLIIIYYFRF